MTAFDFSPVFQRALPYDDFLEKHGTKEHRRRWSDFLAQVKLTPEEDGLLRSFVREMNVLVMAGAWCGDCAQQCPIFQRFAEATDSVRLRFIDKDAEPEAAEQLTVCGGGRVPVVVFLSEDMKECGRYGDRTLARYRKMGSELLGAACPTGIGGAAATEIAEVTADWLREFERIQLMLRTSPRLRQKHGD